VGARAIDDVEKAAIIGRRLSTAWMIFSAAILAILARHIVGVFSDDANVLDIGTRGLRALAFSLPFWGLWVITAGTLRGSGDTRGPMYRGGLTIWTSVALAFIGVHFFDLGIGWVWSTFLISAPISWIGNIFAFKRRLLVLRKESTALAHQP
ncbi:MAG: MATE family efflux transporter, partial [Thermomicrobiales bacterium]